MSIKVMVLGVVLAVLGASAAPWIELSPINVPRVGARACVLDGKIYLVGGEDPEGKVAPLEVYNPQADSWTVLGPSPLIAAGGHVVAAVGDAIFVFAGETPEGERFRGGFFWEVGPGEPSWEQVPGAATMGHSDGAGAAVGSRIYLITGEDDALENEGEDYVRVVDVFDASTMTWTTAASIEPYQREDCDAVALGGRIIVLGGQGGLANAAVSWLNIYDTDTDTWAHYDEGAPFPWEHPRLAVLDGLVYALTGRGEGGFVNLRLDLSTMEWTDLTPCPTPMSEPAVIAYEGKIFVIGGETLDGVILNTVWVYDPDLEE
ncbi:MAG: Kelch repeat type 1-containing protein [Acetothermia bacterium 64_32]|nr:MAG: Kelch repeat type 1-containing protein [Acetothermia bacterium 64_32]MBC7098137.1 hypothetical protein [Candidatus Bipolaricaulota bacterium]HAF71221.1 hypothetical protein [Candidatus Acetothermia bacterium]